MSTTPPADPPAGVHSLWRLRGYLRPHVPALTIMLATSLGGVAVAIAIPLEARRQRPGTTVTRAW